MLSTKASPRPGGRTADTTRRIHDATLDVLVEGGMAALGYQAIAERAGVARATLYRRWPNRAALVSDALVARLSDIISAPDTGSFPSDLRGLLQQIGAFLQSPLGRTTIAVAAERPHEPGAGAGDFWNVRLAAAAPIIDHAVARGEVPADVDREALLAAAVGAIYFRVLVMAAPVDEPWLDRIVRQAVRPFEARSSSSPSGL